MVRPDCVTGQVIGILGPSGIGKTQLSRVLTGLQEPTFGTVTVSTPGGKVTAPGESKPTPLNYMKPISAGLVGFVPQNYPLLRHRTVLGNLKVAAQASNQDAKVVSDKAMEYLRLFGLEDKWDQYPAELSGGQRQRVAIAQQLLCSEHYLILDEPTTGLDPLMKDKVVDLIRKVASLSEENTVFIVSHDIPAVMSVANTLWLLGRVKDERGEFAGATIRHQYDLMERGIAWDSNPSSLPGFTDLLREVRSKFEGLLSGAS